MTPVRFHRTPYFVALTALTSALAPGLALAHPHDDVAIGPLMKMALADVERPTGKKIVSGAGTHKYEYVPALLPMPPESDMKHGHGLALAPNGDIFLNFEANQVKPTTKTLVRFTPDGKKSALIGSPMLSPGAPHGLDIFVESDGNAYLYHSNNSQTVSKTDLAGLILWSKTWGKDMGKYEPTDTAVDPKGEYVYVADGYGSSMVHLFKNVDGIYAGRSFGGFRDDKPGHLNTPHGIAYDTRNGKLVIADRSNSRLEYYTLDGRYDSTVKVPPMTQPCTAHIQGDFMVVADLAGPVHVFDKGNNLVSTIEVGKVLGENGHKHPHDAIFAKNGDIVVATWNPGRISYWKRVK